MGCVYTGSSGGAKLTDTKTEADDVNVAPNSATASKRERTN
jgi:hypothetical protein